MQIMASQDSPGQSSSRGSVKLSPQEEALQSLCKQILKSRFFRGYYEERLYVETVNGYRDIVGLHRSERELEKLLLDIKRKLHLFYQHSPDMWVGITHGALSGHSAQPNTLDTHIWVQLEDIAFGQYWFNIKSVRFRDREIVLKLKMIRPIENESPEVRRIVSNSLSSVVPSCINLPKSNNVTDIDAGEGLNADALGTLPPADPQIGLQDFVHVVRDWGTTIKYTVYDFMSNDITKDNIKDFLQFFGLLVVSILTGTIVAIKYLGTFLLRFMFEFSRFTHTMTPIVLKIIDVINKIVGGFYILVAMMWKDAVVNRRKPPPPPQQQLPYDFRAGEYNRPLYKSIEYNVRKQQAQNPHRASHSTHSKRFTEFERKCQ